MPGSSRLKSWRHFAVLFEGDADRLHHRGVRRGDGDLKRRRGADEFLGLFDGDGRRSHPSGDDPGAASRHEEDEDESDEVFHPVIIRRSIVTTTSRYLETSGQRLQGVRGCSSAEKLTER